MSTETHFAALQESFTFEFLTERIVVAVEEVMVLSVKFLDYYRMNNSQVSCRGPHADTVPRRAHQGQLQSLLLGHGDVVTVT